MGTELDYHGMAHHPKRREYPTAFEKKLFPLKQETKGALIVGGKFAERGMFPWQALIKLQLGLCGGTLIAPSIVVTAAHCINS